MTRRTDMSDILHTPYKENGQEIGDGLSCLGTVIAIAERRGLPTIGWPAIRDAMLRGECERATGFPAGWRRIPSDAAKLDGDVLLYFGPEHPWCAIIHDGYVWSASKEVGHVYCMPMSRWPRVPDELWRFEGSPA